jgi:hypothetical protein
LYRQCGKSEKAIFAKAMMQCVQSRDPPGRFLDFDPKVKAYYEISDEKAADKTKQLLREKDDADEQGPAGLCVALVTARGNSSKQVKAFVPLSNLQHQSESVVSSNAVATKKEPPNRPPQVAPLSTSSDPAELTHDAAALPDANESEQKRKLDDDESFNEEAYRLRCSLLRKWDHLARA